MKKIKDYLTPKNLYTFFLHVAVIALAVQVIILAKQNRELKNPLQNLRGEQLKEGDMFSLQNLNYAEAGVQLDTTSRAQLIFVMTTTCPFCKESIPDWNKLTEKVSLKLSVFSISLDAKKETAEYVTKNNISYPVLCSLDGENFRMQNKIIGVPKTILRDKTGKVLKVWTGKLSDDKLKEVESSISDITTN